MTKTTAHDRTEYRSANTDKGAILRDREVTFGRWETTNWDGRSVEEFVCRYFKTSRTYKSTAGAERAIAKWMAA